MMLGSGSLQREYGWFNASLQDNRISVHFQQFEQIPTIKAKRIKLKIFKLCKCTIVFFNSSPKVVIQCLYVTNEVVR